jgi:hypothetical protein
MGRPATERSRRTTALTCAAMSVVLLAGTLMIWSMSATLEWGTAFGHGGSVAVVAATLGLLLVAAVADLAAAGRGMATATAVLLALGIGATGVLAVTDLFDGSGTAILVVTAAVLGLPLLADLPRATARRKGNSR